jgi:hypothetical protein
MYATLKPIDQYRTAFTVLPTAIHDKFHLTFVNSNHGKFSKKRRVTLIYYALNLLHLIYLFNYIYFAPIVDDNYVSDETKIQLHPKIIKILEGCTNHLFRILLFKFGGKSAMIKVLT